MRAAAADEVRSVPTGTVTFLFTDIEGSTALWDSAPEEMQAALARHDTVLRGTIVDHGGHVFATGGDGYAAAFSSAVDAIAAAVAGQRALRDEPWTRNAVIRVRMGLHSGEADERDGDYFGAAVNRAARVMATAHGGQVVLTTTTRDLSGELDDPGLALDDLGVHRLKGLERPEQIVHLVIDGLDDFAPLRSVAGDQHNLPAARTSFVGRHHELATLDELVVPRSLTTIVGPGGTGKTRLAMTHAAETTGRWTEGAWFVDLSGIVDDDLVASTALTAIGLAADDLGDAAARRAAEMLAGWQALLVIDNCEHVLDGAAELIEELLEGCPGLAVLATSREPLAIEGEHVLRLGGLSDDMDEATRLFVERARLLEPGFDPPADELAVIADVCAELDHLPLAVELAAARVTRFELGDLASELLAGGSDRRQRRRQVRQRSLNDVVQWSLDLMSDTERTVFARLAVFDGGFTVEAAKAVATDADLDEAAVGRALLALVDQSMVDVQRGQHGIRHRLLATIRSRALAELESSAEGDTTRSRHLDWLIDWSTRMAERRDGPHWITSPAEVANQRAAVRYAIDSGELGRAAALFVHMATTLCAAGANDEAARLLAELRATEPPDDPAFAERLDFAEAVLAEFAGDFATSDAMARRLRDHTGDDLIEYSASLIVAHHLDAADPRAALAAYDVIDERFGPTPMTAYGRGEAALTEGRFADAVDDILGAYDIRDVSRLPRSTAEVPLDFVVLGDLAVALHLADRADEALVVIDAIADSIEETAIAYSCVVPLLRAVVGSQSAEIADTVAHLHDAAALERQWRTAVMAYDCAAGAAVAALSHGRPEAAALAYAAIHGGPTRSLGAFSWRKVIRDQLATRLDDDTRRELTEVGRHDDVPTALSRVIESLAS